MLVNVCRAMLVSAISVAAGFGCLGEAGTSTEPPEPQRDRQNGPSNTGDRHGGEADTTDRPAVESPTESLSAAGLREGPPETGRGSGSGAAPRNGQPPETRREFRPPDDRPRHDDRRLARLGIRRYESKRLRLYTDIDPDIAGTLPPVMDKAYQAWVDYFGPLPPSQEGTPYQLTGYIMSDRDLFREAGLLTEEVPDFDHGQHVGQRFWMDDQETDYYRRHLMIHEGTHCFMTTFMDSSPSDGAGRWSDNLPPGWYMEGMAELFGTHVIDEDGSIRFRVMPDNREDFPGFGRIRLVREEIDAGRGRTLQGVFDLQHSDYVETIGYAWAWAACKFFDAHPRYRDRFRRLGDCRTGTQFVRRFGELFRPDRRELESEWQLFAAWIDYGYDFERAAIDFRPGQPLAEYGGRAEFDIATDRGWQSSGIHVERGQPYRITASGRFTLAEEPKPWVSEPQGISFQYFGGRPLGMLVGCIRSDRDLTGDRERTSMLDVIPLGRRRRFTARSTGTLYLRVNDFWSGLADNRGTVRVEVEPAERQSRRANPRR